MAKKDLLGGALWDQYSDNVSRRMNNPVNLGVITEEEAAAAGGKLIVLITVLNLVVTAFAYTGLSTTIIS